jgi:hypothetical protein
MFVGEHRLAIGRRHFPAGQHTERVRKRPIRRRSDLARGADRQRANVLSVGRKGDGSYRLRLNDSGATPSAAIQHSATARAKGSNQPESVSLVPKHCKLLPGFLGAAVSLDLKR